MGWLSSERASAAQGSPHAALRRLLLCTRVANTVNDTGCIVSALARGETDFAADRLREQFGRPIFLVHRLDRATSGALLLAFDRDTAAALGQVMMSREVEKDYWAVCRGWPEPQFTVDHPLDGGPGKPMGEGGVAAVTVRNDLAAKRPLLR